MSALDVLRQIKQLRRAEKKSIKVVEWGNADYINSVGIDNLTRKELRNHLEARDLDTNGTRLELVDRLRSSLADEQLHKFAYVETLEAEEVYEADKEERGAVYVTGINNKGQLGMGDLETRFFFTPIPSLRGVGVSKVSSGQDMTYAITEDFNVYVWGGGGVSFTGIKKETKFNKTTSAIMKNNYIEPQLVKDMNGEECKDVSIGNNFCLGIGRGGDCFVWGVNNVGQLGLGHLNTEETIVINNSFPSIIQVSTGSNHSAVLSNKNTLYLWGFGGNGRLGYNVTDGGKGGKKNLEGVDQNYVSIPDSIKNIEKIFEVSCGNDYTLARGVSGAWSWGSGSGGKLGLGDNNDRFEPQLIPALRGKNVFQVCASSWYSMALVQYPPMLKGGYIYSWGSGFYGQLAQGTKTVLLEPQIVEYFVQTHILITTLALGAHHCLAITKEGELYSWGNNTHGALGRRIDEKDVMYTALPGHVAGFGALVNRIGRGFPRSIACGTDFSVVATYPYSGPTYAVASNIMEEARIREQESQLMAIYGPS